MSAHTGESKMRKSNETDQLYHKPKIINGIREIYLFWAGHKWWKELGRYIHKTTQGQGGNTKLRMT